MDQLLADPTALALVALAVLAVGGLAYAFLFTQIENDKKASKRLKSVRGAATSGKAKAASRDRAAEASKRRRAVSDSLDKLDKRNEDRTKAILKPPLEGRMRQAGMTLTVVQFHAISAALGAAGIVISIVLGVPILYAAAVGFVMGLGLPRFYVSRARTKRCKKFLAEFPGALDVITRAIKSGLPLNDGIRLIAQEAKEPVREEFQRIVENQQMGMSTPDAIARMYERVPIPEANFFGIVIQIQSQAGGNLSEALGNLSSVLRSRKAMRDKVSALSMEAKASGAIIAALPFVVALLVTFVSPGFLNPLWEEPLGHKLLMTSAVMMVMGVGVMKKMITFEV